MNTSTLEKESQKLKDKLRKGLETRGMKPITDEEYQAWVEANYRKLDEKEKQSFRPDYARLGFLESDLELDWSAIKPGFSDGIKAVGILKEAFERGHGMIFLWGNYGQAKTLLGKILVVQAHKAGKSSAYANMSGVLDDIRLAFDEQEYKSTELVRRMDWWMRRDVLFIDELDRANSTPWAQERIFQLLDGRYMRAIREEALTVIASNSSSGELDGYLRSRLNDRRVGPVIHLNGMDGRLSMPDSWKH